MNLLLSGSGAIERFCAQPDSLLIVPTATMAEHARHQLARSGFPVRPNAIQTLAQVLNDWSPLGEAPKAVLHFLVAQALGRVQPARFGAVAEFPGFVRSLAELFEEVPNTFPGDLARVFLDAEQELGARSLGFRNARIRAATARFGAPRHVVFDGFFSLAAAEVEFVLSLADSEVTVSLPEWPGSEGARQALTEAGFERAQAESHSGTGLQPVQSLFSAATIDREVEEIARRVLDYIARGRLFREIAIVLRSRDPYGPLVETTLARFGIPARSYFSDPLSSHPAVAYLSSVVRAMLAGWDRATLLAAVRMPVSGLGTTPAGDQLDFEQRALLPGNGLPLPPALERLASFDTWRRERREPREWAVRLKSLLPQPEITPGATRDQIYVWRSTAAAMTALEKALDGVAIALTESCSLETFWKQAEFALALEPLRVPDLRRNVVHVMDAYEARQWELPFVFVCGLTERHFPQYHREDSIIGDAARRRMGLDTAASRQAEERFLFEIATTRATEETVLSYPRYDEKGEETLPSFFLDGVEAETCEIRVAPAPRPWPESRGLKSLVQAEARTTLSPTSIESFVQCPFQFFARKTLRLRPRPPAPRDRLDLLLQGGIIHRALAEWARAPLLGIEILEEIFEEECTQARIPNTHRTEAVRLELLRNFRGFLENNEVALAGSVRTEEQFKFALTPHLSISGRIDRIDIRPDGGALIIDYKYSAAGKIRERVKDTSAGDLVQGGLYLLAAEKHLHLHPVGMLFCGLKKEVTWDGWHQAVPELAEVGTVDDMRRLMLDAERNAIRIHEEIASGRIAVDPADRDKCKWCDYRDICHIESIPAVKSAGGA